MEKAIIVDHLSKDKLFYDVSFTLQKGEFVGILSPKASGKTTLLKLIAGLRSVSSGFISVMGFDPIKKQPDFLKQLSYLNSFKNDLWQNLPAIETFNLHKSTYEMNERDFRKNLEDLVAVFNLDNLLNIPVKNLSIEHRERIEFALGLIHNPSILLLDDPFLNLDPKMRHILSDYLYEYAKINKTTVLLASDKVEDLIGLARRSIVIDERKLVFDGPLERITENNE